MRLRTIGLTAALTFLTINPLFSQDSNEQIVKQIEAVGARVRRSVSNDKPVIFVSFVRTNVTDEHLKLLVDLKSLTTVELGDTKCTDSGIAHLAAILSLTRIGLWDTEISDAGLETLTKLPNLTSLDLSRTSVTDEGLASIAKMKELMRLTLVSTEITDAGLEPLAESENLRILDLHGTKVTSDGVAKLRAQHPELIIGRLSPAERKLSLKPEYRKHLLEIASKSFQREAELELYAREAERRKNEIRRTVDARIKQLQQEREKADQQFAATLKRIQRERQSLKKVRKEQVKALIEASKR